MLNAHNSYLTNPHHTNCITLLQNLSKNQLGHEGVRIISKLMINNYNIKSLKLSGTLLNLPLQDFALWYCKRETVEINIKGNFFPPFLGNDLDDSAAKYLGDALRVSFESLWQMV